MAGGYGPPLMDFSPLGDLASTFFNAQDRTRKRKLEDLQLQAGGWEANSIADQLRGEPGAPVAPSAPEAPMSLTSAAPKAPTFAALDGGAPSSDAAGLLRKFEGYRDKPYWDVNAYRVGYGSDTITDPSTGQVRKVQPGDRIERGHAEADLVRRIPEFQQTVESQVPAFSNLPANVKAGLTSVAYNYGSLPKSVVAAVETGDTNAIAAAVEGLQGHNGGVNRDRRLKEAAVIRGNADIPAQGARNAQYQIPGQAQQAPQTSAPVSAQPPQIEIPAYIRQGLQSQNPYVRQKAAAVAQKYIAQRQEQAMKQWEVREQEESRRRLAQEDRDFQRPYKERELGQGDERIGIDRERLDWDRNKPMTVGPEQDVIAPDGTVIRAGRQKPNVKTEVINGRVVFIDQDARTASDITPQGLPSGYRPMTPQEKQDFGIPENTGAMIGPDGKPAALPGTANTRVDVNTGQKAGLKYDETISENYAKTFLDIQKSARSAAGAKGTLALMNRLTEDPNFYSGFGGERRLAANKFLSSIGIKDATANAPTEVFAALGNDLVLNKLGGSLGPGVSNSDTQFLKDTVASLATTVPGNRLLIKFTEKTFDRQQEIGRLAREYAKANGGRIDAGFDDYLEEWREQNPLFTEQDFQEAQSAMKGPPAGGTSLPVKVSSPDEARKLPSGTKIILPDGSPGVVP